VTEKQQPQNVQYMYASSAEKYDNIKGTVSISVFFIKHLPPQTSDSHPKIVSKKVANSPICSSFKSPMTPLSLDSAVSLAPLSHDSAVSLAVSMTPLINTN
jgi:hypothetical protein